MKTYYAKAKDINKEWYVIDALGVTLGRLAGEVSKMLRGKHKAIYTPGVDCGDNIIIINAEKVYLSGKKSDSKDGKFYYHHTGYPGGIKEITAGKILSGRFPERVVKLAVKRMMKKNKLNHHLIENLHVYGGPVHPHQAQKPQIYDFAIKNTKNKKR